MNIFVLSECPVEAAQMQCNVHVVKMILESAQMLCTAHRELDGDVPDVFYKSTHKNHPSTIWARSDAANYTWLYDHFIGLCDEYTHRYGKTHLTDTKLRTLLKNLPKNITFGNPTEPPQCMPDDFKSDNTVQAYRDYYKGEKSSIATWNNSRPAPAWW